MKNYSSRNKEYYYALFKWRLSSAKKISELVNKEILTLNELYEFTNWNKVNELISIKKKQNYIIKSIQQSYFLGNKPNSEMINNKKKYDYFCKEIFRLLINKYNNSLHEWKSADIKKINNILNRFKKINDQISDEMNLWK